MQYFFCFFLLILMCNCTNKNVLYEDYQDVDEKGWLETNPVVFEFETDRKEEVSWSVLIRNNQHYPKANLWLFITRKSPTGMVKKDTLDCLLADAYGYWLGKGYGGIHDTEFLLDSSFVMPPGSWTVEFVQAMRSQREKGIVGITDIGFRIERNIKSGKR